VSRTIADLLGQDAIDVKILQEATDYRAVDPTADVIVGLQKPSRVSVAIDKPPTAEELARAVVSLPPLPSPPVSQRSPS